MNCDWISEEILIPNPLKFCDVTQFYSPLSGGVKRYVHEKIRYIETHRPDDEHVLIIPGETNGDKFERAITYLLDPIAVGFTIVALSCPSQFGRNW